MPWYLKGLRPWLLLTLLAAALYLPGLAALPATDRDESRFMQASRQMMESGDFVRIRYMDEARNKKPAGIHWLQVAAVAVSADAATAERWPYRLPSALGALAAVLLLFAAGQTLFDRRTAFLAAALLASSFILVFEAHIAKTDAVLLATVMAAQYPLIRLFKAARDDIPAPAWAPYAIWVALGAGFLIKGPIGPFVVALTASALWLTGHWRTMWRDLKPGAGIPLMLLIAAPWLIAIVFADPDFIREAAGHDFFKKLISGEETHGAPPGYHLLLSLATFAPGSLFLVPALWWARHYRREPEVALCLAWLVPFWLVLEFVPTKLPHYILPAYPALALLVARAALAAEEGLVPRLAWWLTRLGFAMWGVLIVGFAAAIALLVARAGDGAVWFWLLPLLAMAIVVWSLRRAWRSDISGALLIAACCAPLIFAPLYHAALPRAELIWPSRAAAEAVRRALPDRAPRPPVFSSGYREPSLVFALGTATRFAEPDALAARLAALPTWLALVNADKRAAFEAETARRRVAIRAVDRISGFNYSSGERVELTLYAPASPRR